VLALGDGERAHLAPETLVEALPRQQVRLVAGAIGSEAGVALLGPSGPLLDWNGDPVVTRRESLGFERLAAASGGSVLLADEWGALDAEALLAAAKHGLRPGPGGTLVRELPAVHGAWPAALAFALLLGECVAGARAGRGRAAALGATALLTLGAATAPELEALEARVASDPADARALIALGVARAEAGETEEAVHAFSAALVRAHGREEIALASYDLGVALLALGDFAAARDAFFDALAYAPDDRQAKFNLEWALRALASREAPPPPESARPSEASPPEREPEARAEAPLPQPGEPEPAREPEPTPAPPAESATGRGGRAPEAPEPLSDDALAQWLETVRDTPPPSLRRALDEGAGRRSGPQW
jgi:tetratricopeptide (TPR) repeat protein